MPTDNELRPLSYIEPRNLKVLLIDDDQATYAVLQAGLSKHNCTVFWERTSDANNILASISRYKPDIIILDIMFNGKNEGLSLLQTIKRSEYKTLPVIMLTSTMADYKEEDYLQASAAFSKEMFAMGQKAFLHFSSKIVEVSAKANCESSDDSAEFGFVVGKSAAMRLICLKIRKLASTNIQVLITGETGTGKELVARAIHNLSPRRNKPFVCVNCGAFSSEDLLNSELFGHEAGSFTGAAGRRKGHFETASEGTIFLDEIGDANLQLQVRLLRTIQEGEITRVGSSAPTRVNVRIICATNKNLKDEIGKDLFREDLFYRLNGDNIHLPPLRKRIGTDLQILFKHFVAKSNKNNGTVISSILNSELARDLNEYSWPGNIREFEAAIERAIINARGNVLLPSDFNLHKTSSPNVDDVCIIDGIIAGETSWEYIKNNYKGASRKNIILEVCKRLEIKNGESPKGNELARIFKIRPGNMRQILKTAGISLKKWGKEQNGPRFDS